MMGTTEIEHTRIRGLYAIVGDGDPLAHAAAAIDGGAEVVQVRLKRASSGVILETTRRIVELSRGRALVIVNDRPDLALLAAAAGVHLGDEDLPVAETRALVGSAYLIGRTCRTIEEAKAAIAAGADYVGYGPIFESRSKSLSVEPRGVARLRELCASVSCPVVAIGGITAQSIGEIAAAGAAAAAVIEDLFATGDPRSRAEELSALFREGRR